MLVKENQGSLSFAFDSAHVKYGVSTWPKMQYFQVAEKDQKTSDRFSGRKKYIYLHEQTLGMTKTNKHISDKQQIQP